MCVLYFLEFWKKKLKAGMHCQRQGTVGGSLTSSYILTIVKSEIRYMRNKQFHWGLTFNGSLSQPIQFITFTHLIAI